MLYPAASILRSAKAMESGKDILLQRPEIPGLSNYVIFDLEDMPPCLDDVEKVYLRGMQVFGGKPSDYPIRS